MHDNETNYNKSFSIKYLWFMGDHVSGLNNNNKLISRF